MSAAVDLTWNRKSAECLYVKRSEVNLHRCPRAIRNPNWVYSNGVFSPLPVSALSGAIAENERHADVECKAKSICDIASRVWLKNVFRMSLETSLCYNGRRRSLAEIAAADRSGV